MLAIAHLSDIHITDSLDPILARAQQIASAIGSQIGECKVVALVVSGDVAYSGKHDQYQLAIPFFREIRDRLSNDFGLRVEFIICPGNHDCDFSIDQEFRELALARMATGNMPSDRAIEECTSVQLAFFQFVEELCGIQFSSLAERLRYQIRLEIDGKSVFFDCVNLSWVSRLKEEKVTFPISIIPERKDVEGIAITVMHHPFNWLHPLAYREFRKRVRAKSDVVFTGHEHQWLAVETVDSDSGYSLQFEGGVLQDQKLPEYSTFSVVLIDIESERYKIQKYEWSGNIYASAQLGEWGSYRKLTIAAQQGKWRFTDGFEADLSDVGLSLRANGQEISLQDIYVFPEVEATSSESSDAKDFTSADDLITDEANSSGFVIQGDERSGRSALLCQLARTYLSNGYVPLLISGREISRAAESDLEKILAREVARQLGESSDAYNQLPAAKKVFLIDDIDEIPIKSERAVEQLITRLRARAGVLVATATDVYETAHVVGEAETKGLSELPRYRVLPFGHLARTRLIKKWIYLTSDDSQSEDDRVARVDEAEKFLSAVLNRGIVPAYPLYLITLLHAAHSREKDALQDGGFGHYYEYIISEGILAAGIRKEKMDEIYSYCTQLAWFMCQKARDYVSEEEFTDFNKQFCAEFFSVELTLRKDELLRSRLISEAGGAISFRYSYLQYYFVARYLSENLNEEVVWRYVEDSARHLYVRARANALVFLTHFTNRSEVIDVILGALRSQFKGISLAQFNKRNESVDAILRELPKLTYGGGDPMLHREEQAKERDKHPEGDGLMERAEAGDDLSVAARLATVFKTVEIVGQILKARYSSFRRARKEEMIDEVIRGPLRALEDFYDLLRVRPDSVISEFKQAVAEKNRDLDEDAMEGLARRIAGFVVLAVSFDFVKKIAEAVSSDSIREDLNNVINANDDLAYKIVGLACSLDGQRPLPRIEIERALHLGEGSLIVESLVRLLVLYRMYMFRTSAADIQWARDVLKIPTRARIRSLLSAF
jgi:hypothetical protein